MMETSKMLQRDIVSLQEQIIVRYLVEHSCCSSVWRMIFCHSKRCYRTLSSLACDGSDIGDDHYSLAFAFEVDDDDDEGCCRYQQDCIYVCCPKERPPRKETKPISCLLSTQFCSIENDAMIFGKKDEHWYSFEIHHEF